MKVINDQSNMYNFYNKLKELLATYTEDDLKFAEAALPKGTDINKYATIYGINYQIKNFEDLHGFVFYAVIDRLHNKVIIEKMIVEAKEV